MKSFIVLALFVVAAVAAPVSPDANAETLLNESDNIGVGPFKYAIQTSNGIAAAAEGQLKNIGSEAEALEVRGQYSFVAPDGLTYSVTYVADENGFQPSGAHLPQ